MITAFTLQEEKILCRSAGAGWKAPFSIFLRLFNKNIFKQQHAENAGKSAEINVLELLKLQNVLRRPQPCICF